MDRTQGVGGSDAKRIIDGDWHTLWLEKTKRVEQVDLSDVLPVQMGIITEKLNLDWLEKRLVENNHKHTEIKRDITLEVNVFLGTLTAQYSFFDNSNGICFDFLFKINVKGPGQYFFASSEFSSSKMKNFFTMSILEQ